MPCTQAQLTITLTVGCSTAPPNYRPHSRLVPSYIPNCPRPTARTHRVAVFKSMCADVAFLARGTQGVDNAMTNIDNAMRAGTQAAGQLLDPGQGRARPRSKALDVSNLNLPSDRNVPHKGPGVWGFTRGRVGAVTVVVSC